MRCRKYLLLARHLENRTVMLFTVGEVSWERGPGSSESFVRKSCLDNSEKRCNMTFRDQHRRLLSHRKPKRNVPQENEHEIQNSDIFIPRRYNAPRIRSGNRIAFLALIVWRIVFTGLRRRPVNT